MQASQHSAGEARLASECPQVLCVPDERPKMPLGQSDRSKMDKVSTWANRSPEPEESPVKVSRMRVAFFGIDESDYDDAVADAEFQLELELEIGYMLH